MRVLISAEGKHDPAGLHLMMVDGHQFLIDLSGVRGSLVDPTISRAEWGPTVYGGQSIEAGQIVRQDGHRQMFFDKSLLEPYLTAFHDKAAHLAQAQVTFEAELEADRTLAFLVLDQAFGPVVQ